METILSEPNLKEEHYHDTKEHGLVWVLLNKMLHLIVLVYALFGMIRFKVRFIHATKLVKFVSVLMIVHSWYITIKFAFIAACMYIFNFELENANLSLNKFNCSLSNAIGVFQELESNASLANSSSLRNYSIEMPDDHDHLSANFSARNLFTLQLAIILDVIGGPFKLLGNRATLMYGFYSIAIAVMLAVFPIELIYTDIGFNYIRFVLNDPSCLKELYENRQRHLDRLSSWSRTRNSSMLTLSMKMITSQKRLRCRYATDDSGHPKKLTPSESKQELQIDMGLDKPVMYCRHKFTRETNLNVPLRSLRHSLAHNHKDQPSYAVKVAHGNLRKFRPHARSETWFKSSMVVYPIFVFYYFCTLTIIIGAIFVFFSKSLQTISLTCAQQLGIADFSLFKDWSFFDKLIYYETQYAVFALSCASSFYCSYYFGTIIELFVWVKEISQQLTLCRVVLGLSTDESVMRLMEPYFHDHKHMKQCSCQDTTEVDLFTGLPKDCFNQFGGIDSFFSFLQLKNKSQSKKFKCYELMALRLISKKQTLLRATYINMNLFFNELNDTRFMTQTILGRTTQIACGFAFMVSITKSQFESNIIYLTLLLATCLAILNLYLICAALINSGINKLLPQIHGLISASTVAGADHDLLEFWLRHIQAYGADEDALSYRIYGYKITWSSILNVSVDL